MGEDEHSEYADRLEREVGDMERQSERVGAEIDNAREEWERKKRDPSVPGANTPDDDSVEQGEDEETG
jgi:hypothetical protein